MTFIINKSHVGASPRPRAPYTKPATDEEMEIAKRAAKYTKSRRRSGKKPATKKLREKSQKILKQFKKKKQTKISVKPKIIETTLSKQAKELGISETELKRKIEALKKHKSSENQ